MRVGTEEHKSGGWIACKRISYRVRRGSGLITCLKYGYGAQSLLLCGEYCASTRGLRCTLSEEELCSMRADW